MTKVLSSHGSHIPTRGCELQGSLSVVHAKGFSRKEAKSGHELCPEGATRSNV